MGERICYHNHWEQLCGLPPKCLQCGEWLFINAFGAAYVAQYDFSKAEKKKPMDKEFKNGKVVYRYH